MPDDADYLVRVEASPVFLSDLAHLKRALSASGRSWSQFGTQSARSPDSLICLKGDANWIR